MRFLLASAIAVLSTAALLAQQATFRSSTSIVPVLTTVLDAQGRLVPSLEQADFTILDNGKPQELVFFQNEVQPFTVVVMLDFSFSMNANLKLLKAATEQFILRMLPEKLPDAPSHRPVMEHIALIPGTISFGLRDEVLEERAPREHLGHDFPNVGRVVYDHNFDDAAHVLT